MPKKKTVNKNNPEALKEAGNKAFAAKNFTEAIKQYTMAIEITIDQPNHVFYANRANCFLETEQYEECIQDCNKAIGIEPTFPKAFFRKAKALFYQQKVQEAVETINAGLEMDPTNEQMLNLKKEIDEEITYDNVLAVDHPERVRF
jgi:histone-lysine N-methyltransferase SETD3